MREYAGPWLGRARLGERCPDAATVEPDGQRHRAARPGTLIGAWTVRAPGVSANTSLILGDSYFEPTSSGSSAAAGSTTGMWKADSAGGFVAHIDGGDDACFARRTGRSDPGMAAGPRRTGARERRVYCSTSMAR